MSGNRAIKGSRAAHQLPKVHFFKNLPPEDFIRVLYHARCIVGNSSVAIRECSYLGVPAVNVGSRQQGRDRGRNVIDVPYDRGEILLAIQKRVGEGRIPSDPLYGDGRSGQRIADLPVDVPLTVEKRLAY